MHVVYASMQSNGVRSMARRVGIIALIAVSLFVVLARPITRPTGRLNRPQGFTSWSLLAEAGLDDHAPIAPPVRQVTTVIVLALAGALPRLLARARHVLPSPPLRRRKIPSRRAADSPPSH